MATLKQKQDLIDCLCGKVITIDLDIQQINRYWELTDTDGWNPYYLQPYMDAWEDGWEDQKASTKWLETPYGYKLKIKYEYKSFDK